MDIGPQQAINNPEPHINSTVAGNLASIDHANEYLNVDPSLPEYDYDPMDTSPPPPMVQAISSLQEPSINAPSVPASLHCHVDTGITTLHTNSKARSTGIMPMIQGSEADLPQEREETSVSQEVEMMKERFAKLLLGEDLSGGGKGVSTALAISNAITNVSASIFGDLRKLEPLPDERKVRWRQEMERLLLVTDYIVEYEASSNSPEQGSTVMDVKPRRDLHIYLPALKKLDTMLIEALDSFTHTDFWYTDASLSRRATESDIESPMRRSHDDVDRWWVPSPKVPVGGLSMDTRKHLQHLRESVNQILKAALAVNAQTLSEMKVPITYMDSLPKNGRSSLGEPLYRMMRSEKFSASDSISCIDPTQEHSIVDLMNNVEAALHIWKRKVQAIKKSQMESKDIQLEKMLRGTFHREGLIGLEKRQMLMERAESLLFLLRLKFPGMPQTILDVSKIQYCKDVGHSILESYSRVLESLAYNIRSRIDDVIYVDEIAKSDPPNSTLCRSISQDTGSNSVSCLGLSLHEEHPHEPA